MCEEAVGWRMKMAEQNNQQKKGGQQQDANQLIQVRYDKLHELQANGTLTETSSRDLLLLIL